MVQDGLIDKQRDTHPPITVLLTQDNQYLPLCEAQLIMMVGLAVVQRFNPTGRRTSRLKDISNIVICSVNLNFTSVMSVPLQRAHQ